MNKQQGFQPESSLKVTILKSSNKKSIKISLRFSRSYVIPFFIEGAYATTTATATKTFTEKVKPEFIALIPSRSIRQTLAIFSGVEF